MKTTEYRTFQVCIFASNDNGEKKVMSTEILEAETLSDAVQMANEKYTDNIIRVYPMVSLDDADSITAMAEFALASYENWERRNNFAANNPRNRSQWEREDLISIATLAIITKLHDTPDATMFDVKSVAFSSIANEQKSKERNSEREYCPGWIGCNVRPQGPRPTCPALDRLIMNAVMETSSTLPSNQAIALLSSYNDGMTALEIATMTSKNRTTVYRNLYRAYYWVLLKAKSMDKDGHIFALAGLTAEDINSVLLALRKRGHMDKEYK